jgi:hypothetical protein
MPEVSQKVKSGTCEVATRLRSERRGRSGCSDVRDSGVGAKRECAVVESENCVSRRLPDKRLINGCPKIAKDRRRTRQIHEALAHQDGNHVFLLGIAVATAACSKRTLLTFEAGSLDRRA